MMEVLAVVIAALAVCFFVVAAAPRVVPTNWHFGWLGLALLAVALIVWHTVAGVAPVFT